MRTQPWDTVFLLGLIVYVAIRGTFDHRTRHNRKQIDRMDTRDRILMAWVFIGSLLLPVLALFSPLLRFADYRLPTPVPWIGTGVMVAGLWLFWRAHTDLGLNWSMTLVVRVGHDLVTDGVYGRIRHPMYAAIWLFSAAQALLLHNWLAGWSALAMFAPMYFLRVPREEQMMRDHFGESYDAYVRRTGRLWPLVAGRSRARP